MPLPSGWAPNRGPALVHTSRASLNPSASHLFCPEPIHPALRLFPPLSRHLSHAFLRANSSSPHCPVPASASKVSFSAGHPKFGQSSAVLRGDSSAPRPVVPSPAPSESRRVLSRPILALWRPANLSQPLGRLSTLPALLSTSPVLSGPDHVPWPGSPTPLSGPQTPARLIHRAPLNRLLVLDP